MPERFWGPEQLDHEAWVEFASRLDTATELELLLAALKGCRDIADIGGGTGTLTRAIAQTYGRCVVVEPSAEQAACIEATPGSIIDVRPGRAEALPLDDGAFDAAIATWVLQYTTDPSLAVAELARVCRTSPRSRVVLVQAAPQNQLVELWNAEARVAGMAPAHHGYLLAVAAEVLASAGFTELELSQFPTDVAFPENDPRLIADLLQRLHFRDHPNAPAIRAATEPLIAEMLAATPGRLDDSGVLLVARRPQES